MSTKSFQDALTRLVSDRAYRIAVSIDGAKLAADFNLSVDEMRIMGMVGLQSGWVSDGVDLDNLNCCCCCCPA